MGLKEEFSLDNAVAFEDVAPKSNKKFKWVCSQGHQWEAVMANRSKGIGCPYCSGKRILAGYNDLFTVRPDLTAEWSPENTVDPSSVGVGSGEKVSWLCSQGHTFTALVSNRTQGYGCPYCAGKLPVIGVNDLPTLYPDIAKQYDTELNPLPANQITRGSSRKLWWKCNQGHSWQATVDNRTRRNDGCPHCSGRYAIPGQTDLGTTHPLLAAQWHPSNTKTPVQVSAGSSYRATWACPVNSDHVWTAVVNSRTQGNGCPRCWNGVSTQEQEVFDFVKSLVPDEEVLQSDRSVIGPKELDIYIPSLKVAIEFNGLFWHTEEQGKTKDYHRDKLVACQAQGVQLITIWQDDWRDRPDTVKRMLRHKLGLATERVFARKTQVVSVPMEQAREFLNQNHIQGFVSGSYYLGLEHENKLVAVMILRKLGDELYLDRYATSVHVIGGQGKLLAWVQKHLDFTQLVTFADLEVSDGSLYEATGWVRDRELRPDYKYVVNGSRVHKFNYRLKKFKNDPDLQWQEGLTETQLAQLNGIPRIWDCGKIRYVMPKRTETTMSASIPTNDLAKDHPELSDDWTPSVVGERITDEMREMYGIEEVFD